MAEAGACVQQKFNSNVIWNMRWIYHLHHDLHIHCTNLISHFGNHNQVYYGWLYLLPRYNSTNVNIRKYTVTVMPTSMQLQCVKRITEYSTPQGYEPVYHEVSYSVTHLSQTVSGLTVCVAWNTSVYTTPCRFHKQLFNIISGSEANIVAFDFLTTRFHRIETICSISNNWQFDQFIPFQFDPTRFWVTLGCTSNCLCPVSSHVNNVQWLQALLARICEYVHLCLICCLYSEPMQPRHRGTGWTGINYIEKGYVGLTVSLARPEFTMKALAISRPLQDGHLSAFAQGLQCCLVDLRLNYSDLTYKITPREKSQ